MHAQPTQAPPPNGVVVAAGYGLKLYVNRGHLIVQDGVGSNRNTQRFHRATSKVKRVVIIGHDGYITLEAMRWIRDVGAAFVQVDTDGTLIATGAAARHHETRLRRAQALAETSDVGKEAIVQMLKAKLDAQASVVERRLAHLKPNVRVKSGQPVPVAEAIRGYADEMAVQMSFDRLRQLESSAGRNYWQAWARLPVSFDGSWRRTIPDHWHYAGPRTSQAENKGRARKATSPVHAILNYTYAILESEATIAAHAVGLDPSLGIMHADRRYRGSLATDLMEPARPVADELVLDALSARPLARGDITETREGVCRVGVQLGRALALLAPALRLAIAPHAEALTEALHVDAPTPLTRRRHRAAVASGAR